jgi:polar amino acid transport system ATP-binding protein
MLSVNNVSLRYSVTGQQILNNISLKFAKNRITTLVGKSGAGKTSLLSCIGGIQTNYQGIIAIEGQNIEQSSRKQRAMLIGFVFQQFNLFPHLTVLQNCIQPLILTKQLPQDEALAIAHHWLKEVDMASFANVYPQQISGGQQQRTAIARALCLSPRILILDEPTSALDPTNSKLLCALLKKLADQGLTVAVSSHDMDFVRNVFDHAYLIDKGSVIDHYDSELGNDLNKNCPIGQFLKTT